MTDENLNLEPEEQLEEATPEVEAKDAVVVEEEIAKEEVVEETTEVVEEETAKEEDIAAAAETAGEEQEEVVVVKKKEEEPDSKWYSLRVISGKERKIKERIDLEIQRSEWGSVVKQILVPTEKVYKIRAGKKVISERNILPGYILVEAVPGGFTGEMIQAIANVPNVIHFLGRNNPIPMRNSEANRLLGKVDESQGAGEALIEPFIVGETVKIIDGPFSEFIGDIQEVNEEKKKLKVVVKIFGRGTEVELNFMQVDKQT